MINNTVKLNMQIYQNKLDYYLTQKVWQKE